MRFYFTILNQPCIITATFRHYCFYKLNKLNKTTSAVDQAFCLLSTCVILYHHDCVLSRGIQVYQVSQGKVALLDIKDFEAAGETREQR